MGVLMCILCVFFCFVDTGYLQDLLREFFETELENREEKVVKGEHCMTQNVNRVWGEERDWEREAILKILFFFVFSRYLNSIT